MKKLILGSIVGVMVILLVAASIKVTPITLFPNNPSPKGNLLLLLSDSDIGNYNISISQFEQFLATNTTFTSSVQTNLYNWSIYPSNTNSLAMNNSYWKISSTKNVAITNITGYGVWSTLYVYNATNIGIFLDMSVGDAGINSTNNVSIAAGKWGVVSFNTDNLTLTNYCTTTFQ